MKKWMWIILLLALILSGCRPSRTDDTEATTEETTDTTEDTAEEIIPNELDEESLEAFTTLFTYNPEMPWYNMALTSAYAVPEDLDLYTFFYNGFREETVTQDEASQLEAMGAWMETDVQKNPIDKMDGVLRRIFGLGLEEMNGIGLDSMFYLEQTESYYKVAGDFCCAENLSFHRGYIGQDGMIYLYYLDFLGEEWVVTLTEQENGSCFVVSNLPVE